MNMISHKTITALILLVATAATPLRAEPLTEQMNGFNDRDYLFNFDIVNVSSMDSDSLLPDIATIQPKDAGNTPSLVNQGISFSYFQLPPCGINVPHVHPRATEGLFLIEGNIHVAYAMENAVVSMAGNPRVVENDLEPNQATIFPEGHVHYQLNTGCKPARYISILNTDDPGVMTVPQPVLDVAAGLPMSLQDLTDSSGEIRASWAERLGAQAAEAYQAWYRAYPSLSVYSQGALLYLRCTQECGPETEQVFHEESDDFLGTSSAGG